MAGAAQADRAKLDPSGSLSRYQQSYRERPVRCHPDRSAVAWGRGEPGQHARRQRDRARRGGVRALHERRSDSDGEPVSHGSPQSDLELAARGKLPAVYFARYFVIAGGFVAKQAKEGSDCQLRTDALQQTALPGARHSATASRRERTSATHRAKPKFDPVRMEPTATSCVRPPISCTRRPRMSPVGKGIIG